MLVVTRMLREHILGMAAALQTTSCGSAQALDPPGCAGVGARPGFSDTAAFFHAVRGSQLRCGIPRDAILSSTSPPP